MRNVVPVFSLLVLAACKGGEPTPTGPSAYTFKAASAPEAIIADIPLATVDGWDAAVAVLGITDLITTDALVRELLGGAADPLPFCWTTFPVNSLTIRLDFQACSLINASGVMTAERQPVGQAVAYEPQAFSFVNRSITSGAITFTPSDNLRWRMAADVWTDEATPPTTTLGVNVGGQQLDVQLTGRSRLNPIADEMNHWGSMVVSGSEGTQEVWYGAQTAEEANGTAEPDALLVDPLLDDCWCASTGTISLPTTLTPTLIHLDLNRSLEDGGTVWPIITVTPTDTVEGTLMVSPGNNCGRLRGEFVPNEGEALIISGAELQAAVDLACTNNAFGDEEACNQIKAAAADVTEHEVNLGERVNTEMVKEMVERMMDPGFCEGPEIPQ